MANITWESPCASLAIISKVLWTHEVSFNTHDHAQPSVLQVGKQGSRGEEPVYTGSKRGQELNVPLKNGAFYIQ